MSKKAIGLVKRCLSTYSFELDLGNCGLTDKDFAKGSELDTLLQQCKHIISLTLSSTWFEWNGSNFIQKNSKNLGTTNILRMPPPGITSLIQLKELICAGSPEKRWYISNMEWVSELKNLELLNLSFNRIVEIKGLDKLHNLRLLDLDNNNICEIKGLDKLKKLKELCIGGNKITELRNLKSAPNLQILYIPGNLINELKGIEKLKNLQVLFVGYNNILDLKSLESSQNLQQLHADGNQVREIHGVEKLTSLQLLDITNNKVTDISPMLQIPGFRNEKFVYYIHNNPIATPPREIAEQGRRAIINYFDQLEKEQGKTQYLFEAKLLVIGEGGSGKTSFIRKIQNVEATLPEEKDTTFGIDVTKWMYITDFSKIPDLKDITFHVNLWDFGGQKIYQGTHQIFFYDKSLYVLVADTREQKTEFAYWLNTLEQLGGEKSILLVVLNKKYGHEVKFDEGYKQHFHNIIKEVISLDLKEDTRGLKGLQDKVKYYLKELDGIGDPLPPSWVQIREALTKEKKNFISFERFRNICAKHKIKDESMISTLSGYYNRIGAITHYIDDKTLQDRVYLDSNWLVDTVYKVIDSDIAKKKEGILSEEDVKKMWKDNELAYEVNQLTTLMHKFGLMYHIPNSDQYVIPAHLPVSQPYKKWEFSEEQNLLQFHYEFEKYMPQGILSHIVVSLHQYIYDQKKVWHKGVNICKDGAYGEIIESLGSKNSFEIRIAGINKRELLAVIREQFAAMFRPFKNLKYQQKVPCICDICNETKEKHFYGYTKLKERLSNGKTTIECEQKPYLNVNIGQLIASVDVPVKLASKRIEPLAKKAPKNIFISYSHKDEKLWKDELCKHLTSLADNDMISQWNDRQIEAGQWDPQIEKAMNEADIFILLITANFISSGYISSKEIATAYEKYKEGKASIIPVICSSCKWEIKPLDKKDGKKLGDLQAYPKDGKPIKKWTNKEDGFLDVVNQLERLLKS